MGNTDIFWLLPRFPRIQSRLRQSTLSSHIYTDKDTVCFTSIHHEHVGECRTRQVAATASLTDLCSDLREHCCAWPSDRAKSRGMSRTLLFDTVYD